MTARPVFVLALIACDGNATGNLAAPPGGDTSHPARRGSPVDDLVGPCGPGSRTDAGSVVRREPYLQDVTPRSAMIGWVTTDGAGEHVRVTSIDGATVAVVPAVIQRGETRSDDETQVWARLSGLEPSTVYCYAVERGAVALTERTGFRTAPLASSAGPVRFMAFGDSGSGDDDQRALRDRMFDMPYDLVLHTGDIAYDSGTIDQYEDHVFAVYARLLRNVPMFPIAGNHDYKSDDGQAFRDVFALPDDAERFYSFDWGRVHFVGLDTEADYGLQAAWLAADLAATRLPWRIVYMHHPMYSSGAHGSDLALRALLAPVFARGGVQLVLAGHDHDYERMHPQNGVAYVVTGGGGRRTRAVDRSEFTAFAASVIHFVYVEVGADQLVLHAIDGAGVEFDSMVVPRTR